MYCQNTDIQHVIYFTMILRKDNPYMISDYKLFESVSKMFQCINVFKITIIQFRIWFRLITES